MWREAIPPRVSSAYLLFIINIYRVLVSGKLYQLEVLRPLDGKRFASGSNLAISSLPPWTELLDCISDVAIKLRHYCS